MTENNVKFNRDVWDRRYQSDWKFNSIFRKLFEETKRKYFTTNVFIDRAIDVEIKKRLSAGSTILDAGCGPSSIIIEKFMDYPWKILTGMDISIEGLRLFNKQEKKSGSCSCAVLGDTLRSPFKFNTFDIVVSMSMVEYLTDDQVSRFFSEMKEILHDNGYIILAYPNRDSLLRKTCMNYARRTNLTECMDDTRMYESMMPFINKESYSIVADYTVGITSQLFYINYYMKRNIFLRLLRPFYSFATVIVCMLFGWVNPFLRKKGDYRITVIQKKQ